MPLSRPLEPAPRRRTSLVALAAGALVLSAAPFATALPAAAAPGDVTVSTDRAVYLTPQGQVVNVAVTLAVEGGGTLGKPVTVSWSTGSGTALPKQDYVPARGTVTFPAGATSGTRRTFGVQVYSNRAPEKAETIPLVLSSDTPGVRTGSAGTIVVNAHGFPYLDASRSVRRRVDDLLKRMTLEEKVGQMTQAERAAVDTTQQQITDLRLGSLLSGGGSTPRENDPAAWADMIDGYQARALAAPLQIPLVYGIDAVHGNNNVQGATIFPHNVGMGAARDPELTRAAQAATAVETRAIGVPWTFAPCVCVARDDRWGRAYEAYGEHPALVITQETAIEGLQGNGTSDLARRDKVLATVKHFAGDGDTRYGTGDDPEAHGSGYPIDQGITVTSRADFERIDLSPYVPAVERWNAGSVMPSYSSVDFTDDGVGNPVNMHGHRELLQGWLKDRQGFGGFVISDYNGIDHIGGEFAHNVRTSVNAGVDMFMQPNNFAQFHSTLLAEVRAGRVSQARVDDAVRRILTKKFQLGLFERPFADRGLLGEVGAAEHRALARTAAARSQVLLKNSGGALPLERGAKVYVAGRNADDLGNQAGGWTITWQGMSGRHTEGTTILQGMRQLAPRNRVTFSADASAPTAGHEVGVVVVGETPYAEGFGDVGGPRWAYDPVDAGQPREPKSLSLNAGDRAVVQKVCAALPTCVVLVVSGRTQVLTDLLPQADAVVASWLPGSEGAGVADVLYGREPFTGQLPVSWPRTEAQQPLNVEDEDYAPLFPFGWGLGTGSAREDLAAARTALRGPAAAAVDRALAAPSWAPDGSVADRAAVLRELAAVPAGLGAAAADGEVTAEEREFVRVLRLLVQDLVEGDGVPAAVADPFARADVALLEGRVQDAVGLLLDAAAATD
ncbi:hypothetical protein NUM3379_13520 [Kineococcus sp. NUM-3379]